MTSRSLAPVMQRVAPPRWVRARLDDNGNLLDDVKCVGCQYSLHGSPWDGQCPECGKAAAASLRPDSLSLCDRTWLARMVKGINVILIGLVFGIVMGIALVMTLLLLFGNAFDSPGVELVVWSMAMPPGLVIAWGIWQLTAPEPGVGVREWAMARGIARGAAMLTTAMALLTGPLFLVVYLLWPPKESVWELASTGRPIDFESSIPHIVAMFPIGVGGVATIVFGFATLIYATTLALRDHRRSLAINTGVVGVMYLILCSAPLVGMMLPVVLGFAGFALAMIGFAFSTVFAVATALYTLILVFVHRHMLDTIVNRPLPDRASRS